jgi:hypothetical protein
VESMKCRTHQQYKQLGEALFMRCPTDFVNCFFIILAIEMEVVGWAVH